MKASLPVDVKKEVHFLNRAVGLIEKGEKGYVWLFMSNRIDLPRETFASCPD